MDIHPSIKSEQIAKPFTILKLTGLLDKVENIFRSSGSMPQIQRNLFTLFMDNAHRSSVDSSIRI